MLEYIGEDESAEKITSAVYSFVKRGEKLTSDLGGGGTTEDLTVGIIGQLTK